MLTAACGPRVDAPSLGLRPVERQSVQLPAVTSEAEEAPDPALATRLAALVDSAEIAHRGFQAELARAEPIVGRGSQAASGSEEWIVAQEAVSALDAARKPVRDAAAVIAAIRVEPGNAGSGSRAAVEAAAARIEALDDGEAAATNSLTARLGSTRPGDP